MFLEAVDDHATVLSIHFDYRAAALGVLRRDHCRAGASEGIVNKLSNLGTIQNEPPKESHGLHRRMQDALARLWVNQNAFVLRLPERMSPVPAIQKNFVLWEVI